MLCASFVKLVWDGGERARAAAAGAAGAPGGARGAAARRPALASRTGLARAPRFYKRSLRFCPLHLLKKPGAAFRGNDSLRWRPRWRRAGCSGRAPGLGTVRVPLCGLQSFAKAAGGETLLRFHCKCDEVIPGEKRPSPRRSFLAPPAATIRAPSWDGCG